MTPGTCLGHVTYFSPLLLDSLSTCRPHPRPSRARPLFGARATPPCRGAAELAVRPTFLGPKKPRALHGRGPDPNQTPTTCWFGPGFFGRFGRRVGVRSDEIPSWVWVPFTRGPPGRPLRLRWSRHVAEQSIIPIHLVKGGQLPIPYSSSRTSSEGVWTLQAPTPGPTFLERTTGAL